MKIDNSKKVTIKKNPTKQKIIVEQGRQIGSPSIEHKILYTEVVLSLDKVKDRIQELKEEYKDIEALSIFYFSV